MKRFSSTKCLLAAAVALALPSLASAANVGFEVPAVNKYSSAVIVNQNSAITVKPIVISASSVLERIGFDGAGLAATDQLLVTVTVSGAEIPSTPGTLPGHGTAAGQTADPGNLGAQLSGALAAGSITPVREGNNSFSYSVTNVTANASANTTGFVLKIPSFRINRVSGPVNVTVTLRKGLDVILTGSSAVPVAELDNNNPVVLRVKEAGWVGRGISSLDIAGNDARKVYADGISGTVPETLYSAGGFTLAVRSDVSEVKSYDPASTGSSNQQPLGSTGASFRPPQNSKIKVTVNGSNFSAWLPDSGGYNNSNIWLDGNSACSRASANDIVLVANAESNDSKLVFNGEVSGTHFLNSLFATGTVDAHLCFGVAADDKEMTPQSFSNVTVELDYDTNTISSPSAYQWGGLQDLIFTGKTVYFHSVSPAGNPRNDSILRLVNHNTASCVTRVHGQKDDGIIKGPVVVTLAAGQSMDITSGELENGASRFTGSLNAGGVPGAGRWKLRTSSECNNFDSFVIQRNTDTGTLTNLHEQGTEPGFYYRW